MRNMGHVASIGPFRIKGPYSQHVTNRFGSALTGMDFGGNLRGGRERNAGAIAKFDE
jgi:hypothetical protein